MIVDVSWEVKKLKRIKLIKMHFIYFLNTLILFLDPLGASENSDNANLLFSEFIDGFKRAKNQKELVNQF
jgi:hypothetical protein